MAISAQQLKQCIHLAGFPVERRSQVADIILQGVKEFREHKSRWYYSASTEKKIKKPSTGHYAPSGRHDQAGARAILISSLCRAWIAGFGTEPTLNNKKDRDTPFAKFSMEIMQIEGIGHTHQHLEEYWSLRKKELHLNQIHIEEWRVSGGS